MEEHNDPNVTPVDDQEADAIEAEHLDAGQDSGMMASEPDKVDGPGMMMAQEQVDGDGSGRDYEGNCGS